MTLRPIPADRAEWLAQRERYIGSSEVAALFGLQAAYGLSHFALWHVKRGIEPPPVEGPRIAWGTRLEEVIALAYAEETGATVTPGRYAVDDTAQMAASLDFEIAADPENEYEGPGILETKNVDWLVHRRSWTDGEPPPHILLQLQHQLACTGFKWGVIAAIIGGNELRTYRYAARPALAADIRKRVTAFWASASPPPVDGSDGAAHVLRELYPEPVDDAADMRDNNEWPEAVQAFIEAGAAQREAKAVYDEAKNRVVALLGPYKRAWGGGYSVSTAITPAKPPRSARPEEVISGRAEVRRYTAKETTE